MKYGDTYTSLNNAVVDIGFQNPEIALYFLIIRVVLLC